MPKRKTPNPERSGTGSAERARFEIGGQWIGHEAPGGVYYRYWYEPGERRRVSRRSLGTRNLEEAKRLLAQIVVAAPPTSKESPDSVYLVKALKFYMDQHGKHTVSAKTARRACKLVLQYLKEVCGLKAPAVSDFNLPRQHAFFAWAHAEPLKLSAKSIATYMVTIKAAMAMSARPRVAHDARGEEREVTILDKRVFIEASEAVIAKLLKAPRSRPRAALPDFHELAAFLDAIQEEHIFRYCIAALNTWARPEAVCELDFAQQADFRRGLVDLNPPGRPQNNKIRPVIPLTENLRTWALFWNQDRPINYQGVPVTGVDARTFRKVAERAGTATENGETFVVHSGLVRIGANGKYRGTVTPYTLRHFMATNIRNMPGIEVTREQRAEWMGHVDQDNRTTQQWYESFDRDYLEAARRATDAIMEKLNALAKRTLWPVSSAPAGGLTLVSKPMVRVTKKEKVRKEDTSV